jgi:ribosome maturation factor RimP
VSGRVSTFQAIIEGAVAGMGYEPVDVEHAQQGLLRVYIDAPAGITIDDCEKVSRQLSHLLTVEGIDYARLEVSSPGLDRPLKRPVDFERFAGERAAVRLRLPFQGRRNFEGLITVEPEGRFGLELVEPEPATKGASGRRGAKGGGKGVKKSNAKSSGKAAADAADSAGKDAGKSSPEAREETAPPPARKLVFSLDEIERARLVPDYRF